MMARRREKCLLVVVVANVIVQSCFDNRLLATTRYLVALVCPVCNTQFEGYKIASTNTFGGQDRDFLTRASGYQPTLLFPKTCPKCFYSGYQDDFTPKVEIADVVKEQILHDGTLKPVIPIAEGVKAYEIPAYAMYDLIAQTYQLRGKTDEVIAEQFLRASWATRLEFDWPTAIVGEELMKKVGDWVASRGNRAAASVQGDKVLSHLQTGREYEEVAKSSEGETRMIAALAAIHTLRRYGENAEAQTVLPVLKTVMPAQQYSEFEHFVNDSIACEQKFQAKALPLFERVIPTKENPNEKAGLTYLCGELHRRLGNRDKAKFYYEQCVAIKGHPQWLETWAKEQSDLPPK